MTNQREYEALEKEIKDATEREQKLRRDIQREERALEDMLANLQREEQMISQQEEELKVELEKNNAEKQSKEEAACQEVSPQRDLGEAAAAGGRLIVRPLPRRLQARPGCPPLLVDVCLACLEDAKDRPKDGRELVRMLLPDGERMPKFLLELEEQERSSGAAPAAASS